MVKCSEVLQCNGGTSNKVSSIIIRHIDNRKLLLICILLLSHSLVFFRYLFYKIWLYFMYFYWKRLCILIVVYVFLFLVCILIVVYVFLDAATLTEVFLCFLLSCKANARV